MSPPSNDNTRPPRRLVPLIGILRPDGRLERCHVVQLLPHPLDLVAARRSRPPAAD